MPNAGDDRWARWSQGIAAIPEKQTAKQGQGKEHLPFPTCFPPRNLTPAVELFFTLTSILILTNSQRREKEK